MPNLGDVAIGDTANAGANVFMGNGSIGRNFINNRNTMAEVVAEANDYGTDSFVEIVEQMSGRVDFEPRLATGNAILVITLFVDVLDAWTSDGISNANVALEPAAGAADALGSGSYVFDAIPFRAYAVTASATDYDEEVQSVDDPDLIGSIEIPLQLEFERVASILLANFESADTDGTAGLSLAEARTVLPGMTSTVFNRIDTSGDGVLTAAELSAVNPVPGGGCVQCPGGSRKSLEESLGDLFLLGLALTTLFGWKYAYKGR